MAREAYLDIETTGLSARSEITVIGVFTHEEAGSLFSQLVGDDISAPGLLKLLDGVSTLYTYNGSRFDLPFINMRLGLDLDYHCRHYDLMYRCWEKRLYGGFKSVETQLGIGRTLKGVDGYQAVRLWWRYRNDDDQDALRTLLEYNREDVLNLKALKEKLLDAG
ncbi:MAG: ribonuclease H-like domain-containing protein [Chloroflexi bacterium]|nr:ribonuclease H-like domain-containing protein [Chloroflexota bacterium]